MVLCLKEGDLDTEAAAATTGTADVNAPEQVPALVSATDETPPRDAAQAQETLDDATVGAAVNAAAAVGETNASVPAHPATAPPPPPPAQSSRQAAQQLPRTPRTRLPTSRTPCSQTPCKYHLRRGGCAKGDACHFLHASSSTPTGPPLRNVTNTSNGQGHGTPSGNRRGNRQPKSVTKTVTKY